MEVSTSKAQYKKDIKAYVKTLMTKIGESNPDRAKFLKENLQKTITEWIQGFDNMTTYRGESMDDAGTYVLCKYPEGDCPIGSKIDVFILKDAVEEEKCVSLQLSHINLYLRNGWKHD